MDIRYHLTSLVAVFFALGIGLVIGMSLADDGAFRQEQAALIRSIENQLGLLRNENTQLSAALGHANDLLAHYDAFMLEAGGWLIGEALQGKHVTVLTDERAAASVRDLTAFLAAYGVEVSHIAWLPDGVPEGILQRIARAVGRHTDTPELTSRLAEAILGLDAGEGLAALASEGLIAYDVAGQRPDAVVIVSNEPLLYGMDLAQALAQMHGPGVVAMPQRVQAPWAAPLVAEGWVQAGPIDTLPGRIHVAWLLMDMVRREDGDGDVATTSERVR